MIVPESMFIIRDHTDNDYGTDMSLELIMPSGYVTNFRSHVQLKSVKNGKLNKDNSFSYPAPIKTINYLINQPNSLFIIYLENKNLFLWEWVDAINQSIKTKGIDLYTADRKDIVYHFNQKLNKESFSQIYNHILTQSTIVRDVLNILNVNNDEQMIQFSIDAKESKVKSSKEAEEKLKKYGITLCNEEKYSYVSEWISLLPAASKRDAEVSLAVSYYMTHIGQYLNALNWLPKGKALTDLEEKDILFVDFLNAEIRHTLGLVETNEYINELKRISEKNPNDLLCLQSLLMCLRLRIITDKIDDEFLVKDFNDVVLKIKSIPNLSHNILKQTELTEFDVEGILVNKRHLRDSFKVTAHIQVGRALPYQEILAIIDRITQQQEKWISRYNNIIKDTNITPLLHSRYILSFSNHYMLLFQANQALSKESSLTTENVELFNTMIKELEKAYITFEKSGLLHESLSAKSVIADIYCELGYNKANIEILQYINEKASEIGLYEVSANVEKLLKNGIGKKFDIKEDISKVHLTEEEIDIYAQQYLEAFDLPKDRYSVIRKEYWWVEQDRYDEYNWCKSICTIQDLRHTYSKETLYSIDPQRRIFCKTFEYKSPDSSIERDVLISEFKTLYCKNCKSRKHEKTIC